MYYSKVPTSDTLDMCIYKCRCYARYFFFFLWHANFISGCVSVVISPLASHPWCTARFQVCFWDAYSISTLAQSTIVCTNFLFSKIVVSLASLLPSIYNTRHAILCIHFVWKNRVLTPFSRTFIVILLTFIRLQYHWIANEIYLCFIIVGMLSRFLFLVSFSSSVWRLPNFPNTSLNLNPFGLCVRVCVSAVCWMNASIKHVQSMGVSWASLFKCSLKSKSHYEYWDFRPIEDWQSIKRCSIDRTPSKSKNVNYISVWSVQKFAQ